MRLLKEQVKLANFLQKRFRSHANGTVSDRPAPGGADLANLVLMRKFVIRMMKVRENISLLGMNSFGFDVSARRLVEFASAEDLRQAFASMPSGEPWYVLGGGNNVLFTADYGGTLLHPLDRSVTLEGGDGERALSRVGRFRRLGCRAGTGRHREPVADTGLRRSRSGPEHRRLRRRGEGYDRERRVLSSGRGPGCRAFECRVPFRLPRQRFQA